MYYENAEQSSISVKKTYFDDFPWVVVGYSGHPASTDTVGSIDQDHGDDGHVPLWFDPLVVVQQVLQDGVVVRVEDHPEEKKTRPVKTSFQVFFKLGLLSKHLFDHHLWSIFQS